MTAVYKITNCSVTDAKFLGKLVGGARAQNSGSALFVSATYLLLLLFAQLGGWIVHSSGQSALPGRVSGTISLSPPAQMGRSDAIKAGTQVEHYRSVGDFSEVQFPGKPADVHRPFTDRNALAPSYPTSSELWVNRAAFLVNTIPEPLRGRFPDGFDRPSFPPLMVVAIAPTPRKGFESAPSHRTFNVFTDPGIIARGRGKIVAVPSISSPVMIDPELLSTKTRYRWTGLDDHELKGRFPVLVPGCLKVSVAVSPQPEAVTVTPPSSSNRLDRTTDVPLTILLVDYGVDARLANVRHDTAPSTAPEIWCGRPAGNRLFGDQPSREVDSRDFACGGKA